MTTMAPVLDLRVQTTLASPGRTFVLDARFTSTAARTALIGPSGSGKSTLLMAIAGLAPHQPARLSGHVRVAGTTLLDTARGIDLPTRERRIGMVFQDYALFPHLSVAQNLAFGLCRLGQRPTEAQRARIDALVRQFGLEALRDALPRHLSGGQRQRVALARAIAPEPALLLLDEPLSALDTQLRIRLRAELAQMLERVQIPVLLVTHDPSDVAALAQAVVQLDAGRVVGRSAVHMPG